MAIYDVRNRFMISNPRVLRIINECTHNMTKWGFKLPSHISWYSCNCKNRLGLANYRMGSITLSEFLFKESKDENIMHTVYHELGHLAAGPGAGHGPKWKAIMSRVKQETGLEIKRLASTANYEYFKSEEHKKHYKYFFKCKKCGCTIKYEKHTKFVDTYNDTYIAADGTRKPKWVCSHCGGTFEQIKGE